MKWTVLVITKDIKEILLIN